MTEHSRTPRLLRRRKGRSTAGAVYVEVLVAIIPVLVFFFGLLQMALLYTAKLVIGHAAQRAVRSAVVVLEDDPERFDGTPQGEITYHDTSSTSGSGGTEQFLQGMADVLKVKLPTEDVENMMSSESGPRLAAIQRAAYMPLATLAPNPQTLLQTFGMGGDDLGAGNGNLAQFVIGLLLYNRAAAMVTLRKPDGTVANCVGATERVTVRVTYLYLCTIPIAANIMCDSLMSLSGLDQLDDAAKNAYKTATSGDLQGLQQAKDGLTSDLQRVSDRVAGLSREFQYAASPELILPFLASRAHFKLMSAEASLPNQGAFYYDRKWCGPQPAQANSQDSENNDSLLNLGSPP